MHYFVFSQGSALLRMWACFDCSRHSEYASAPVVMKALFLVVLLKNAGNAAAVEYLKHFVYLRFAALLGL